MAGELLNRKQMEAVIAGGGSIIHKGRHIAKVEDLPSDSELALAAGTAGETSAAMRMEAQRLIAEASALDEAAKRTSPATSAAAETGEEDDSKSRSTAKKDEKK